jgi:hypothetical protein
MAEQSSSSGQRLLASLRTALHGYYEAATSIHDHTDYKPGSASIIERELSSKEADRGEVETALSSAGTCILAAQDCLVSHAELLNEPMPLYGPIVLARSVMDNSARAWWLLDPEIGPKDRAGRGLVHRFNSLAEASEVARVVAPGETKLQERTEEVARSAEAQGFTVHKQRRSGRLEFKVVGYPRPSTTRLITDMKGDLGRVMWKYFSGATHGTTYALMQNLEFGITEDKGHIGRPSTRVDAVITTAATAAMTFGDAMSRQVTLYGWPRAEWDSWHLHAVGTIQGSLRATGVLDK